MYDSSVLDNMAPIRPSKLIWQMPYDERKSFLNENAVVLAKFKQPNLTIKKQTSLEFEKANESDCSDFENIDDFIDDQEEFGGASRAVKHSIRALNINMMIYDKKSEIDPS